MPVLHIHSNIRIDKQANFLTQTSSLLATLLAKPEAYVMVILSDQQSMSFAGSQEPTAFLELKSLGLSETQTKDLSFHLCTFLEKSLKIDSSRIYIEFSDPQRCMFGWNKSTF